MGYFDYEKKNEYLICIDSDGCAMDTMEVKHRECFGPQWIYTYGLGEYFDECMKAGWILICTPLQEVLTDLKVWRWH